mmetsp:Transcript_5167/g.15232  ORF Transcript_5167/g.15232 Transcript_5167/m.15232 type:complete len:613 (-) Transcript_5167:747-2585(-)
MTHDAAPLTALGAGKDAEVASGQSCNRDRDRGGGQRIAHRRALALLGGGGRREADHLLCRREDLWSRRVVGGRAALDARGKVVEPSLDGGHGSAREDELRGLPLADLDHAREDLRVVEARLERRDRHHLRDGGEAEDLRRPQPPQVLERVGHELERVGDEEVEARERGRARALPDHRPALRVGGGVEGRGVQPAAMRRRPRKLAEVGRARKLAPDGLRPKGAAVDVVLEVVAQDVCLLQEEAHRVCQPVVCAARRLLRRLAKRPREPPLAGDRDRLEAARDKGARQPLADQAGDRVAVPVVHGQVGGALPEIDPDLLRHARAHPAGDVADHLARLGGQPVEEARDGAEALQQLPLRALADAVERPRLVAEVRVGEGGEVPALRRLVVLERLHVVFDGVERAQHEVEEEHVEHHLRGQLPDHRRERPRDEPQDPVAKDQVARRARRRARRARLWHDEVGGEGARAKLEPDGGEELVDPRHLPHLRGRVLRHLAVPALLVCGGGRARAVAVGEVVAASLALVPQRRVAPLVAAPLGRAPPLLLRVQLRQLARRAALVRPVALAVLGRRVKPQDRQLRLEAPRRVEVLPPAVQPLARYHAEPGRPQLRRLAHPLP